MSAAWFLEWDTMGFMKLRNAQPPVTLRQIFLFSMTSSWLFTLTPWALPSLLTWFWLVQIIKWSFVKPIMIRLSKCSINSLHMRLFFLRPSLIGSIKDRIFILINRLVVLMGLSHYKISKLLTFLAALHTNVGIALWVYLYNLDVCMI